jgi:uncharacterized membrane protein YkvA (DUF1232 family)
MSVLEPRSPTRKHKSSTTPVPLPDTPAAATKMRISVGVSAPTPWIIPTPNAVARPEPGKGSAGTGQCDDAGADAPAPGTPGTDRDRSALRRVRREPAQDAAPSRVTLVVLRVALIGVAVLVLTWLVMIVLAKRLPPGSAKDLATVLPACVTTCRRLRKDPRVPRRAKVAVAIAGLWVLSPIDVIPEFLPVIGPLDDVVVVALAFRYAARRIPPKAIYEAWPAEPRLLARLIGPAPGDLVG